MLKIAQILPDISGLGGLATRTYRQHLILNSIKGFSSDCFKLTRKKKNLYSEENKIEITNNSSGIVVKQNEVSYNELTIKETIKILNQYDILIFNNACPHLNENTGEKPDLWKKLYTDTKGKKIAVISDTHFVSYYPWFADIVGSIDVILAMGYGHKNSVIPYFMPDGILEYGFIFGEKLETDDRDCLVWPSQWKEWKGIVEYLEICEFLKEPTNFYGIGRAYYEIRKNRSELFKENIGKDFISRKTWNKDEQSKIFGTVSPETVIQSYKFAKASVDLTGINSKKYYGHYNNTTLEPMLYGCVSIVTEFLAEPYTHVPEECLFIVDGDYKAMANQINLLCKSEKERNRITKKAYEWLKEFHDGKKVLKKWIDYTINKKEKQTCNYAFQNGKLVQKSNWW
jgi:glycosyltransferase involved in cell wall biosynthesis